MSRGRIALAVAAALAACALAALLVPTLFLKPYSIDHFYSRLFLRFAWHRPLLLSQLQVLEPLGLRFHQDELDDLSVDFQIAEAEWLERQLAVLRRYDRDELAPAERHSYDAVVWFLEDIVRGRPFIFHDYPLNQFSGAQSSLPEFMLTGHRLADLRDARAYVARIGRLDEVFAQLREGLELRRRRGIVAPRFVLRLVLREMRELIAVEPEAHPLHLHLAARLEGLAVEPDEAAALLARLRRTLQEEVYPAYGELIAAVEAIEESADDGIGAWRLPDGAAFYDYALDHHATLDVSAEELHRRGLAEVARLEQEARRVLASVGLEDDEPAAGIRRLARDSRFLYPSDDEGQRRMLDDYRRIIDESDGRLAHLFEHRPPARLEVEPVPESKALTSPPAYYQLPTPDGSRPGVLFVNLREIGRMPRFSMRTLAYHEAIPGHHLQGTMAVPPAPLLRRILPLTAFVEGWALYAERLAAENGLLDDPYDRLGYLEAELFRAVRLVVDTGIHDRRWERRQAIDYMLAHTGLGRAEALVEVERQIVNPGRACAYKIGQLEMLELRRRARSRLGDRFDLRRFHTAVLENGALPLALLERVVDGWIEGELEEGA